MTTPHHDDHENYLEGIRLFNDGFFWHAHERWEECWLGSTEPDYTFYKAIIQAAAALYHWRQKQNPRGLYLNWAKSRAKLLGLPTRHKGLDLRVFLAAMDRFVYEGQDGQRGPEFPQLIYLPCQPGE